MLEHILFKIELFSNSHGKHCGPSLFSFVVLHKNMDDHLEASQWEEPSYISKILIFAYSWTYWSDRILLYCISEDCFSLIIFPFHCDLICLLEFAFN